MHRFYAQKHFAMKNLLRIEELLMFGLSIYLFSLYNFSWWLYPILILLPDIGMLGYLINTKIGALSYNLFHHKGIAVALFLIGALASISGLALAGIILFGHASMDRIFGYGLKYPDHFKNTHLGTILTKN